MPRGFSFYPGKNLGAMGDAGALTTDDAALASARAGAARARAAREVPHDEIGWTARLDTFQAPCSRRKLPLLDGWNAQRRAAAAHYLEGLDGVGDLALPPVAEQRRPRLAPVRGAHARIRTARRASLRERESAPAGTTRSRRISADAYAHLGYAEGAFPVAERLAREVPLAPDLPGMHRGAGRARRRVRSRLVRPVADSPANDAPYRAARRRRVRRRRRRPLVHEPLRLLDRRRHADRPLRRDPARRGRSARAARSRATRSSATASTIEDEVFVGHGVMFVNDKYPRATHDGRRASARRGLGAPRDGRRATERRSARARSCSAGSRVGAGRSSAPALSSPGTCSATRSSPASPLVRCGTTAVPESRRNCRFAVHTVSAGRRRLPLSPWNMPKHSRSRFPPRQRPSSGRT